MQNHCSAPYCNDKGSGLFGFMIFYKTNILSKKKLLRITNTLFLFKL